MRVSRFCFLSIVLLGMLGLAGCDEGISPTGIDREVSITPLEVTLSLEETQQFEATVIGMTDTILTWSVDGGSGWGTVSETGLFRAPSVLPAAAFKDPSESTSLSPIATVRASCRNHPLVTVEAAVMFRVPDFAILDVNENSDTYGSLVSAHEHTGKITAWYFGHASS